MTTERPNADQARFWTEEGGPEWVRDEVVYERMLEPFDDALLEALALRGDESVLEVGCGFGATALALAAHAGSVHGVDLSPAMIDRARERAAAAGVDATFAVGDAQVDPLGGPYDAVASRFGVMFFDDPVRAFTNVRAATAPGGRLAFVCWQPIAANPWMGQPVGIVRGLLDDPPPPPVPGPGPFAFGDPAYVTDVVVAAGWSDAGIIPCTPAMRLGGERGVAGAVDQMLSTSVMKQLLALGDASLRDRAAETLAAWVAPQAVDGVVTLPAAAWVVRARA